jgi:tetratricopeptide (TPR) repeat protein/ribonuclease BN (tRNA processing enzyme)
MIEKNAKQGSSKTETEFQRLFWEARKSHRFLKQKATADDSNHKSAAAFATAHRLRWGKIFLEASRLDSVGAHDRALELLAECEPEVPGRSRGLWYFLRGSALSGKNQHDDAIEAYKKALDEPTFDARSTAWNNLGTCLHAKGEHEEAISVFRKALREPTVDGPGDVWNNLGIALYAKGERDEAIRATRKALDDPQFASPGYAWNNLGIIFSNSGEYDKAIEAFRKALGDPHFDTPAKGWANLAQTYVDAGKARQAEEAFENALAAPDPQSRDHLRARFGLHLLKSKIDTEALSPDDRAMAEKTLSSVPTVEIESGVIAAIQEAGDTQYEKYIARLDSARDNTLSLLRGWSSAVTLLEGSERRWRGGGYFLKWRGYGIVIDPGFDFLRNFHDAGYHGREIQAVIVSHNHPDHNSDLKDVDDLRYELFKRLATTGKIGSQPYVLLWDQDTDGATDFGIEKPRHHHEPVVLACGFPQPIDLRIHPAKIPARVIPFKVSHGNDVPHAMGVVVELINEKSKPAVRIGYTGDTAYFEDLYKHLADCDIVIAHISQPSIEELQDASKLKEVHLGYRGTARLLQDCKPKLALIGEFWAGFTDLRISLVKGLRQRSGVNAILPAGLGMHLRLPSLDIECTECAKPTPFSEIKVAPPPDNFGSLAYLCADCIIG